MDNYKFCFRLLLERSTQAYQLFKGRSKQLDEIQHCSGAALDLKHISNTDSILVVHSSTWKCVLKALEMVILLFRKHETAAKDDKTQVRMLVDQKFDGRVIGKCGMHIQGMIRTSGAHIRLYSGVFPPPCYESVLLVRGSPSAILSALECIHNILPEGATDTYKSRACCPNSDVCYIPVKTPQDPLHDRLLSPLLSRERAHQHRSRSRRRSQSPVASKRRSRSRSRSSSRKKQQPASCIRLAPSPIPPLPPKKQQADPVFNSPACTLPSPPAPQQQQQQLPMLFPGQAMPTKIPSVVAWLSQQPQPQQQASLASMQDIRVPVSCIDRLVGQNGFNLQNILMQTGCILSNSTRVSSSPSDRILAITGLSQPNIDKAVQMIQQIMCAPC
jgi:hypothetical protein